MTGTNIGKKALENLNRMFSPGTRVEAVVVIGVPSGEKGTVKKVRATGDIEVEFDGHGDMVVRYPEEVIRVASGGCRCVLKMRRGGENSECDDDCNTCGWNPKVSARRKAAIQKGALSIRKNGIRYLSLKSKVNLS